jgi:glucuronate isomerase
MNEATKTQSNKINLSPDRFFSPEPNQRKIARELYETVKDLPLICPHGHVDPAMFADENYNFGTPTELLFIPDHYIFRMLYSQGYTLEELGIPRIDGGAVETDHRKIWQIFAENFYLFRGTPTGVWLNHELAEVFGVDEKLSGDTAQTIYEHISAQLAKSEFRPRALFERFKIEVLATTDTATDTLEHHKKIRESGWKGKIIPTFRPDAVVNLDRPDWLENIKLLGEQCGFEISSYKKLIQALENRREFFKSMGATATDHAALTPFTVNLSQAQIENVFERAFFGEATAEDARLFTGHLLIEMARMSTEDGLVMQFHPGSFRNHNETIFQNFGYDKGADIPQQAEFTNNLKPLLDRFGNDKRLTLILFTLDETVYSRELATLAGHYPCLKLGPPWWFHDSPNGMTRFRDAVMETAGIYNTAGFNDDTRAFPSIPARHDLARRIDANWLAGLVVRGLIDEAEAAEIIPDLAVGLARKAYKLKGFSEI